MITIIIKTDLSEYDLQNLILVTEKSGSWDGEFCDVCENNYFPPDLCINFVVMKILLVIMVDVIH